MFRAYLYPKAAERGRIQGKTWGLQVALGQSRQAGISASRPGRTQVNVPCGDSCPPSSPSPMEHSRPQLSWFSKTGQN